MLLYPVNPLFADLWLAGECNDSSLFYSIETNSDVYYVRFMDWKKEMWKGFGLIESLKPSRVIFRANYGAIVKFMKRRGAKEGFIDYSLDEPHTRVRMVWHWSDEITSRLARHYGSAKIAAPML